MAIYGYCRVSRPKQNIERQIRNIKNEYPEAIIYKEVHTRTSMEGRKVWGKLAAKLENGDMIVFDSVSRLSGSEEGYAIYKELLDKGVDLVFLKEPHINSAKYRKALQPSIQLTGTIIDPIIRGVNEVILALADEDIKLAFQQSAKEVEDLRQRTKEGLVTARNNGKTLGRPAGRAYSTKKATESKKLIRKYAKEFGGTLTDVQCLKLLNINRNTYYKYKSQIREERFAEMGVVEE